MPYYAALRNVTDLVKRKRIIEGLKRLRTALAGAKGIPERKADGTLLLATWNIREFDSGKYGYRDDEAYLYIAEIISRFDLIAIQEVQGGLYPLQRLKRLLGSDWDFLVTDVTLGDAGNGERMAYLFDRRKVDFTGLAAELVIPRSRNDAVEPVQLARSPYLAGFRAGWAYLTLATVHIYYGTARKVDPRRLAEITTLCETIAKNAKAFSAAPQYAPDKPPEPDNLILLGDFNIFATGDATLEAVKQAGFEVPDALTKIPGSNVAKNKHYDQIAYYKQLARLKPTGNAGVFDFFESVYRDNADEAAYDTDRKEKPGQNFKEWRTYRMSDHLPMWIELGTDDTDAYLDTLL